ncbi:MAG TPA: AAA family ATPase [Candidatus Bathyarchaeia archaeon]|nr:AAA family ATPase [Candidatus Bathyarchaeia archaeon]
MKGEKCQIAYINIDWTRKTSNSARPILSNNKAACRKLIREVQLSNFMSYKNTSIPLRPGLNLIIGPNGAGKSSILLAISVVLGQAYTERAKKLSELIRWNEQEARISLLLDNEAPKGARPFPQARSDKVLLTRVLKRSGDYHYLLNNKPISKTNLVEGLSRIGLNPDNMLVIMHQLMVGRFGSVSPIDKLLLLEDAVGFGAYRREVLDASSRLQKLTTERETMSSVLEGTRETYLHWQREYEKYELKRKLEDQWKDLQRELLWRRIIRRESSQKRVKDRISSLHAKIDETREEFETSHKQHQQVLIDLAKVSEELEGLREEHLKLEHGRGLRAGALEWISKATDLLRTQQHYLTSLQQRAPDVSVSSESNQLSQVLSDLGGEQERISNTAKTAEQDFEKVRTGISDLTSQLSKNTDLLIESRVKKEVSNFKLALMEQEVQELEVQLRIGEDEIGPLRTQASQLGPVFESPRDLQQISPDVASVQERLRPLAHLSAEVEKMYKSYGELYEDLKKKAEVVEHNRSEVLGELRDRFDRWKLVMDKLLEDLSARYNTLLSEVGSNGRVVIKASKDIEKAGLELYAGFKGNEPVSLDGLAPSGGERTVALIAFLLSLQQFISSPFRAIDEFDVHMDPRNRETVSKLIHAASRATDSSQYIAITPGQVTLPEDNVHVIVVQNVEGSSMVKEIA